MAEQMITISQYSKNSSWYHIKNINLLTGVELHNASHGKFVFLVEKRLIWICGHFEYVSTTFPAHHKIIELLILISTHQHPLKLSYDNTLRNPKNPDKLTLLWLGSVMPNTICLPFFHFHKVYVRALRKPSNDICII